MVVGGSPSDASYDVELIDLTGQERSCTKPNNFPVLYASVGTYLDNGAIVCGGNEIPLCSNYSQANPNWSKVSATIELRRHAASSFINGHWWVSNGNTSEIFDTSTKSFRSYVNLPAFRRQHNIIAIDENTAMLLGGTFTKPDTFIFRDGSWENGTDMQRGRRQCQAGLVTFPNGTKMVAVAGGHRDHSTEFYEPGRDEWHFGKNLPYIIKEGASVQMENTFLIVGGHNGSGYLDTIWKFDTVQENWALQGQKLNIARQTFAAFLVPDEFC